jgi:hypothetical protein
VRDAAGRELPARFDTDDARLTIRVDARGAVYPLTVDPLFHTEKAKLALDQPGPFDNFGWSVGVSGSTAVVGAPGRNSALGAAYVFRSQGGVWTLEAELLPDGPGGEFGIAVAISGKTIVVGAIDEGAAYVFKRQGGAWNQQAKLHGDDLFFGFGAVVAVDGSTIVVGGAGAGAFVFTRHGDTWPLQTKLVAPDETPDDFFGSSVGVSGDTIAVGASNRDAGRGAVYVFTRRGHGWQLRNVLVASDGQPGDSLGASVAIRGDTLVAGAPNRDEVRGAAYVFEWQGHSFSLRAELASENGVPLDNFGFAVAVEGNIIVVGAPGAHDGRGVAYVYVRKFGPWQRRAALVASDRQPGDGLGWSVAVSGAKVVVGAPFDDNNHGAAYVFKTP